MWAPRACREIGVGAGLKPGLVAADARCENVLYRRGRSHVALISRNGTSEDLKVPAGEYKGPLSISADGKVAVFTRRAPGALYDEVLAYDRGSEQLHLVSANSAGAAAEGEVRDARVDPTGRYVVFRSTAANLGATAGAASGFIHDLQTARTERLADSRRPMVSSGAKSVLLLRSRRLGPLEKGACRVAAVYFGPDEREIRVRAIERLGGP